MEAANDNTPRLMAPKEAAAATTVSRVMLSVMAKEGLFPAPVKVGVKRIAYVRAEVEEWIEEKIASHRGA